VGTILIVPLNDQRQLLAKRFATNWYQWQLGKHQLHRQNESFHQGNTPVLTHLTEARLDLLPIAPVLETLAGPELRTFVADEMLWLGSTGGDGSAEKRANSHRARFRLENGNAHNASGVVVYDDGYPPAEGPTLWQGKG
jgi:hypothetical protein